MKANKALAHAESLLAKKLYLQGSELLARIPKEHKGTDAAKTAEERIAVLDKDEAAKKEIAAQKTLDRIVGGLEMPKEKLKGKEREAKAAQLQAFIKKNQVDAPGAAEVATVWQRVMAEDWKAEK